MDRLETLTAFVAVAESGAFVAASRKLGRSPTAITRAVAGLEAHLSVRLFNRTTRAVALTEAGRRYLEICKRVLADFSELQSFAASDQQKPGGELRVAASVVFGRLHVQPLVSEFLRRHPALDIRLELSDRVVSLTEEGIDVGIRIGHLRDSTLKAIRVGYVRRGVYASPAYLVARGTPKKPADLAQHTCIAFTAMTPNPRRWSFGSGRRSQSVAVSPRLTSNLADAAIDSAVGGLGLTCVLSYMVDHLVAAGALRPVLTGFEPAPIPLHVVHPAGKHPPLNTRTFVDAAVESLRRKFAS